ncbi:hypothetical protein [Rhodopila sp.]|uniref:hypothetical protein n=1 Tax=Rhodopila sp. TaxID=2480087 RepID=UPI002CAA1222|nr:hypothetical protein [Rhodopila sp.]HVZ07861.1 hypothetical protein [Rhodopila sp.]
MPARKTTPPPASFPEDYDRHAIYDLDGPIDPGFVSEAVRSLLRTLPLETEEPQPWIDRRICAALDALAALHPRDEIEVMLAVQAIAANQAAMNAWYLAMNAQKPQGESTRHLAAAASAARTFDTMLKALERRQAKPLAVPVGRPPSRTWPESEAGALVESWARRVTGMAANDDDATETGDHPASAAGDRPAPNAGDRPAPSAGDRPAPSAGDDDAPGIDDGSTPSTGGNDAPSTGDNAAPRTGDEAAPAIGSQPAADCAGVPASASGEAVATTGGGDPRMPVWTATTIEMARKIRDETIFQEDYAGLDVASIPGVRDDGGIIVPEDPTPEQEAYMARRYALNIRKKYHENLQAGINELPKIIALRPGDLIP